MRTRRLAVGALAAAAGLAVLYGVADAARSTGGGGGGGLGGGLGGGGPNSPLTINGDVDGLYPGGAASLSLHLANPHSFDVVVSSLRVEVLDPDPGCAASALTVDDPPLGTVLRRRSTTTFPVTIRMSTAAPSTCQGAAFPLRYTVTVTKSR